MAEVGLRRLLCILLRSTRIDQSNGLENDGTMWYTIQEESSYDFDLLRGVLNNSPNAVNTFGSFLSTGLSDTNRMLGVLRRIGLTAAADRFAANVSSKEHVRIGDFGEIITGRLLVDAENVVRPIEKLRYRESSDWPMKLTDVFCVRMDGNRIASFMFAEAKAGTTPPPTALGKKAYEQLYRDAANDEPAILFFTLNRLSDAGDETAHNQLEDAMHAQDALPTALRLVFVFDDASWRESVLSTLQESFEANELELVDDFACYALTCNDLKRVIDAGYAEAERIATLG